MADVLAPPQRERYALNHSPPWQGGKAMRDTPKTPNWWWTVTRNAGKCDSCGEGFPARSLIAFDSHGRQVLCEVCADSTGVAAECKESRRFRNSERLRGEQPLDMGGGS